MAAERHKKPPEGQSASARSWLTACFALSLTAVTSAWGGTPVEKKILADDGVAGDNFGYSVAADGDTMVAGAPMDTVGTHAEQGSAYVFQRDVGGSNAWGQVAHLVNPDGLANDRLGESVAIHGDVIVVGTSRDYYWAGAAYVFERNAGGANAWGLVAKLTSPDGEDMDYFGWSVAVRDNVIAVGAFAHDLGGGRFQGAAYVFDRWDSDPPWRFREKLVAPDGVPGDYFGASVAIGEGINIVVGALGDDGQRGSAYVFWAPGMQKLTASDGETNDLFGSSVAATKDKIVVGAQAVGVGAVENQGAAYVFEYSPDTLDWQEAKKLHGSDTIGGAYFGCAAAVRGDVVVVGARGGDPGSRTELGAAYVFQRDIGGLDAWGQIAKLAASNGVAGNCFGRYVAIANNDIAAGAHRDAPGGAADRGSVYLYEGVPYLPAMLVLGTNRTTVAGGEAASVPKGTDFGTVTEGQMIVHTLSITNPGAYTLHVPAWSLTGLNTRSFQVSGVPRTVTAGAASNFTVAFFSPLPRASAGMLAFSNDAMPGPYIVNLAGTAVIGPRTALGTPYWWLERYGWTNYEAAEALDPDADGMVTWKEWVADTDPTSPASVLRILGLSAAPPWAFLFRSSLDRLYSLLFTDALIGGAWSGVPGQADIPGNGGFLSLVDTNDLPCRFYRIGVKLP